MIFWSSSVPFVCTAAIMQLFESLPSASQLIEGVVPRSPNYGPLGAQVRLQPVPETAYSKLKEDCCPMKIVGVCCRPPDSAANMSHARPTFFASASSILGEGDVNLFYCAALA